MRKDSTYRTKKPKILWLQKIINTFFKRRTEEENTKMEADYITELCELRRKFHN